MIARTSWRFFPFYITRSSLQNLQQTHTQKERNLVKASNEYRLEILVRLHSLNSVVIPGGIWDIGRERRGCLGEQSATKPPISYYTCGLSLSSFKCPCNKLHSCDCSRGAGPVFRCSCAWQCPARARLSAGSIRAGFDRVPERPHRRLAPRSLPHQYAGTPSSYQKWPN